MPVREKSTSNDVVIVFCSQNMSHIIRGMKGYDNTLCIQHDISIDKMSEIFRQIIFGAECSLFEKRAFVCLTSILSVGCLITDSATVANFSTLNANATELLKVTLEYCSNIN